MLFFGEFNMRCSVLSNSTNNRREVTVLLKGSIFVMHHLFKTMHAREGLKNWSNTNEPHNWKSSWQSEWCRRNLATVLKRNKTLITASISTQLLGEQKVIRLMPSYATEMSAFVISIGNIYMYLYFLYSALVSKKYNWTNGENPWYWRMCTKHLPVFLLASSKSSKITWDLFFLYKIVINSRSCGWIPGPSALSRFWFGMLLL